MVRVMALYDAVSELPLEIDSYELERLEHVVSPEFTRVTTLVHLRGGGEEGIGEDVTYTSTDHPPPADLPLAGSHALDSFSQLLDRLTLFTEEPQMQASHDYRRWAFESAALDLALRQAGRSLAEAVGREPRPVTFVTSRRLVDPPSADQLRALARAVSDSPLQARPDERLDGRARRRARGDRSRRLGRPQGPVRGHSRRPAAGSGALPARRRRRSRRLGRGPGRHRRDAADPRAARRAHHLGRADPLRAGHREPPVAAAHDQHQAVALRERQAALRRLRLLRRPRHQPYGGGQWELGPGRGHIQYLASLFHPDTPNDVAPGGYNAREPQPGLPTSPLEPQVAATGFRWG